MPCSFKQLSTSGILLCDMKLFYGIAFAVSLYALAYAEECLRHGTRCPEYTVIKSTQEYEIRYYPSLTWISASERGKSKLDVSRKLIKYLYEYLQGGNEKGEKFAMMVPVRTKKVVYDGYNFYTMAIALRLLNNQSPPRSINSNVIIVKEQPTTYITRSFGGFARADNVWDEQAAALKSFVNVNDTFYYMCVYDSPWKETDRLNEVWMTKQ